MSPFFLIILICLPFLLQGQHKKGEPLTYENMPKELVPKTVWIDAENGTLSINAFKSKEWPGVDTAIIVKVCGKDTISKNAHLLSMSGSLNAPSQKDMNRYYICVEYIKKGKIVHTFQWEYQWIDNNGKKHLIACEE